MMTNHLFVLVPHFKTYLHNPTYIACVCVYIIIQYTYMHICILQSSSTLSVWRVSKISNGWVNFSTPCIIYLFLFLFARKL
jgi:hypothetical protein